MPYVSVSTPSRIWSAETLVGCLRPLSWHASLLGRRGRLSPSLSLREVPRSTKVSRFLEELYRLPEGDQDSDRSEDLELDRRRRELFVWDDPATGRGGEGDDGCHLRLLSSSGGGGILGGKSYYIKISIEESRRHMVIHTCTTLS